MNIFSIFKKSKEKKMTTTKSTDIKCNTPINSEHIIKQTKRSLLSNVTLAGYESLSGGYMSYTEFLISGHILNIKTGRKNLYKKTIYAQTKDDAIAQIIDIQFIDDPKIEIIYFPMPTERQINYATDLGAIIPPNATREDVSAIISRFTGALGDSHYDPPQESPSEEFALFAQKMGIRFSKFIGEDDLFNAVVHGLEKRDKIAFYAYCVLKSRHNINVSTSPEYPDLTKCYKFADTVLSSKAILSSINDRTPDDYKNPHKGTTIYKAVAEFFIL